MTINHTLKFNHHNNSLIIPSILGKMSPQQPLTATLAPPTLPFILGKLSLQQPLSVTHTPPIIPSILGKLSPQQPRIKQFSKMIMFLALGLTFIPSWTPPKVHLPESLNSFDRNNRLKYFFQNQPFTEPHPFKKKSTWEPPSASLTIEKYLKRIRTQIDKLHPLKVTPNLSTLLRQKPGHQECRQRLRYSS